MNTVLRNAIIVLAWFFMAVFVLSLVGMYIGFVSYNETFFWVSFILWIVAIVGTGITVPVTGMADKL